MNFMYTSHGSDGIAGLFGAGEKIDMHPSQQVKEVAVGAGGERRRERLTERERESVESERRCKQC